MILVLLKPASGMEEMTMDMAGAGVVAGNVCSGKEKAKVNVVGIVGLVENMSQVLPKGQVTLSNL